MKAAIMQPYYFPYIGYFQLIAAVDLFIVYDNIKFTKKGWINRNRMLRNGKDVMFTLPLKKDSDYLDICDRELADDFSADKLLNQFKGAYQCAPYFLDTFPLLESILLSEEKNLFRFLYHSLLKTCKHLNISTEFRVSSDIDIDHSLKSQDKVLALCEKVNADIYLNAIGGIELYSKNSFSERGVHLNFIKPVPFVYQQFGDEFIPWLSIVDVMMFNSIDAIQTCITTNYELV